MHSKGPPNGIIDNIGISLSIFFPQSMLFLIGAVSPIGSTKAEIAAYEKLWLKPAFCSTMTTDWRGNELNLIQMEWNSNNRS